MLILSVMLEEGVGHSILCCTCHPLIPEAASLPSLLTEPDMSETRSSSPGLIETPLPKAFP